MSSSVSSRDSSLSPPPKKQAKHQKKSKGVSKLSRAIADSGSEEEEVNESKSTNKLSGSEGDEGSGGSSGASGSESEESGSEHSHSEEEKEEEFDDDDGERSRHSSEEDEDIIADEEEKERSSRSRSRSVSGSGSPGSRSQSGSSSRSGSGSDDDENSEAKKVWEKDPEMYGIRRSNRKRPSTDSKPPKLIAQVSSKSNSNSSKKTSSSPSKKSSGGGGGSKKRKISSDEDDDDSSSDEEVTRNVRSRNKVVSYKEEHSDDDADLMTDNEEDEASKDVPEEEEHLDTIEKIIDSREGKKGATGPDTTIYSIEENGDPNVTLPDDTEKERQFLIKWTGLSHLHNTYESFETLTEKRVKGLKKLDNFCKKEDEHRRWKEFAYIEDVEYMECQLELQAELYKAYNRIERIITERVGEGGVSEFFVKWECLPYADATWESGKLIQSRDPDVIQKFRKREASNRTPSSSTKSLRHRPKFVPIKYQPEFMMGEDMKLELRDYQLDGLNWLVHSWCKENSVILADEMGLGKTIQTICYLHYLFETYQLHGPFLVVVPLSTMAAWQLEFTRWAPQINVVTYVGDVGSRDIIREYEWCFRDSRKMKFNAILTTYEIVLKDKAYLAQLPWAVLMVDEAHRLKNGESLLYKTLCEFETNHRLLITGTPLQNSLRELWSLLHFIMPYKFDDWESFEKEHDQDQAANKGYNKLHKQLEPFILRRVKKDVEKSLPAKVEQILRVEMTTVQKQYYKWILTKNYTALRKGVKGSVTSFVNVVMELKKCCNHASLVKPMDQAQDNLTNLIKGSGKLMLLDKLLVRLKETGHRVLIFSQMVMMLDIIAEYLQHRRFSFQRLDGSIKGDMRKQALDHFNAEGSQDFCFLLSTRAGGLGINLATADTVIIFDSDWNPQNDLQAQARAHRIGQKNQVNIYRLVTKNSVEEDIVERAKQKMVLDHLVIQRMDTTGRTVLDKGSKSGTPFSKDELNAILKFGAEQLFQEDDHEGEDHCDIDEILRRAETHEEAARPGDELLSAFKVASFSMNEDEADIVEPEVRQHPMKEWEAIIPEDLRQKVEQEEKEKEMADLYLPPRSSRSQNANNVNSTPEKLLGNEALNKKARGKKRKYKNESEDSDYEDDDGRSSKKRGRPKGHGKDGLKGFTEAQVRKFLKSVKKFPCPLMRIDLIAQDAGLTEKNATDLKKLGELLINGCKNAIAEQKANPQAAVVKDEPEAPAEDVALEEGDIKVKKPQKIREKGPIYKVCGVNVNARTMSIALEEMEPLADLIPYDESLRKQWKFDLKAKAAQYDVDWGKEEDTKLLQGVWEFGMGAYDKIREADAVLKEKIFLEGDKKPTLKHVSQRADYLLRVIKKHQQIMKTKTPKPVKEKKKKGGKNKKDENAENTNPNAGAGGKKGGTGDDNGVQTGDDVKEKKKRAPRKKKDAGPMHFAAKAEPRPLNVLGDLDPVIFNECKEKMRPVKKALKALDNPDPNMDEREQIEHTKRCLIQVGDRIQECLMTFSDKEKLKEWKSNLWYFVSKFTEYDAQKLHRVYKKAIIHRDGAAVDKTADNSSDNTKHSSKDKEKKHRKHKKDKSSDKADHKNFNENSNSSLGGGVGSADSYNSTNNKASSKSYARGERERGSSKQAYNNSVAAEYDRNSNDSFTPSYGQYNRAKQYVSQQSGVANGPTSSSHYTTPHDSVVYRERQRNVTVDRAPGDPRVERAPGDPRDRGYKNYHSYDQGRGPAPNSSRQGSSGWSKNSRGGWDTASHYGGPARREDYNYSPLPRGSSSTIGAPPPPAIGGLSPGPYPSSSSSTVGGRIAPPLSTAEQWRRSDPKRNNSFYPNASSSVDGRGKNSNSVSRRPDYDKY